MLVSNTLTLLFSLGLARLQLASAGKYAEAATVSQSCNALSAENPAMTLADGICMPMTTNAFTAWWVNAGCNVAVYNRADCTYVPDNGEMRGWADTLNLCYNAEGYHSYQIFCT